MLGMFIISWGLTFGMIPDRTLAVERDGVPNIMDGSGSFATLDLSLSASRFTVFTSIETYQSMRKALKFSPTQVDYSIGARFKASDMVTFNITHHCEHPVSSGDGFAEQRKFYNTETRVFISFRGDTKL